MPNSTEFSHGTCCRPSPDQVLFRIGYATTIRTHSTATMPAWPGGTDSPSIQVRFRSQSTTTDRPSRARLITLPCCSTSARPERRSRSIELPDEVIRSLAPAGGIVAANGAKEVVGVTTSVRGPTWTEADPLSVRVGAICEGRSVREYPHLVRLLAFQLSPAALRDPPTCGWSAADPPSITGVQPDLTSRVASQARVALLGDPFQAPPSLGEDGPDGVLGDAELLADLAIVQILQVVEPDHLGLALAEVCEHPLHFLGRDDRLGLGAAARPRRSPGGPWSGRVPPRGTAGGPALMPTPRADDGQIGRQRALPF